MDVKNKSRRVGFEDDVDDVEDNKDDDEFDRRALAREVVYVVSQMVVETVLRIIARKGAGNGETRVGRRDWMFVGKKDVR